MSSGVTLSVTESDLYQALGDYLRGLFSDAGIERTQQNRVPMPQGDFITMTGIDVTGLSTAVVTYSAPEPARTLKTVGVIQLPVMPVIFWKPSGVKYSLR